MTENEENFSAWMESLFSEEKAEDISNWSMTELLWGISRKLFERPQYAIDSVLSGKKKREAAFTLFWYSYNISIGKNSNVELDTRLQTLKQILDDYEDTLNGEIKREDYESEIAYHTDIINFRAEFPFEHSKTTPISKDDSYVIVVAGAGRILLNLHRYTAASENITFTPLLKTLIQSTYEIVSKGLVEVENYSPELPKSSDDSIGEGLFGFTACIASAITSAAFALMNLDQEEYETAFLVYTEAFQYLNKAVPEVDPILRTE